MFKIIGIVLLVIFCLILSGILSFLFVPVRYQGNASYDGKLVAGLKISWLLHLVHGYISYVDGKVSYAFKILWVELVSSNPKPKKDKKKKTPENKSKKKKATSNNKPKVHTDDESLKAEPISENPSVIEEKCKEVSIDEEKVSSTKRSVKRKKPLTFWQKLRILFRKVKSQIVNIKYTILKFCDKIKEIRENISFYLDFLQAESTKQALGKIKQQFYRVFRNMKPRRFSLFMHLGFSEQPQLLGQILAIHGMLYPFHNGKIVIESDFEGNEKYGSFYVKGRITAYVYLHFLYLYLFDKDIKECKRVLTKKEETDG